MSTKWTLTDMPDFTGKIIIVTGANSGVGFEASKAFARKGATVILACRSMDKAQLALKQLQTEIPNASAEVIQLDLSSLASVRQFAEAFQAKYQQLDVLVNNAGIMMVPYGKTEDGFERQLGTNHMGHFALTGLLIDLLRNAPQSRVVSLSSGAHTTGKMDFGNLMFEDGKDYTPMASYARSKLANLLFTYELQRRLAAAGTDCIAVAAHPGMSKTNLASHSGDGGLVFKVLIPILMRVMGQEAANGALPTIRAAVGRDVSGGDYYGPGGFMELRGNPVMVKSSADAHSEADAKQLWQVSEALTGVQYLSESGMG